MIGDAPIKIRQTNQKILPNQNGFTMVKNPPKLIQIPPTKGDLSNDTTVNPPLFSLVNTFNIQYSM
jgi:hypothetical protein